MVEGLPALGNGIDKTSARDKLQRVYDDYMQAKSQYDQIEAKYNQFRAGQVGPEVGEVLKRVGPRKIQKLINEGRLTFNVNYKNPYIGFTYRF